MHITMEENGRRWLLEPASTNGRGSWLLSNESGQDAKNVYLGINSMDPFQESLFLENLDDTFFVWSPSPTDFLRIGWDTDHRRREVVGIPFPSEQP